MVSMYRNNSVVWLARRTENVRGLFRNMGHDNGTIDVHEWFYMGETKERKDRDKMIDPLNTKGEIASIPLPTTPGKK